jgi:hypothetical protein
MDANVTSFLYINSPDDMAAVANQLLVSFPSWTDAQGNCMKVSLSKTAMGGASAGKSAPGAVITSVDTVTKKKAANIENPHVDIRPPGTPKKAKIHEVSPPRARR